MAVILLNALPLNAIPYKEFAIQVHRISLDQLRNIRVGEEVKCFIRHEGTVKLLSKVLGIEIKPSAELYQYNPEDRIYVVSLKRPQRGQEVTELTENDVEVFEVVIARGVWL